MPIKRRIEIYSAGCAICRDAVMLVEELVCSSCQVIVKDMSNDKVARQAKEIGITSVPAIVIDGQLADCCASSGIDIDVLKSAGVGVPIP